MIKLENISKECEPQTIVIKNQELKNLKNKLREKTTSVLVIKTEKSGADVLVIDLTAEEI